MNIADGLADAFNEGYKQGQIDTIKRFCNITPPKTNADRIRSMTDEELAEFEFENPNCPPQKEAYKNCQIKSCRQCWLDWLNMEASE